MEERMTRTVRSRFNTGFKILSLLLSKGDFVEWLPVQQLWSLLISVACQHTGKERLQVISLLLEMINLQQQPSSRLRKGRLELSALKPLWQLYTTIVKDCG